jgi:hypothetical protein
MAMVRRRTAWAWTRELLVSWVTLVALLCLVVGIAFVVLARGRGSYWSSVWINIGTTLFLAIPLVLLERLLETRIRELRRFAEESIEDVRSDVEGVRQEVNEARMQIAGLGQATARRIADARAADAGLVQALREDVSQRNTWHALRRADELEALDVRGVRVRLPKANLRVRFKAVADTGAVLLGIESPEGDQLVETEYWAADELAEQVVARLAEALQRAGSYPGDESFDAAAIFERLAETLETVLSLRSGGQQAARLGPVVELANRWAITSDGLERIGRERRVVEATLLRSSSDQASVKRSTRGARADFVEAAVEYHRGEHRRAAAKRLRPGG